MARLTYGYVISSKWNALMSSLDGDIYETLGEAMHAIGEVGGSDLVVVSGNDETEYVYADQDDADRDEDGGAPHRMLATVAGRSAKDVIDAVREFAEERVDADEILAIANRDPVATPRAIAQEIQASEVQS